LSEKYLKSEVHGDSESRLNSLVASAMMKEETGVAFFQKLKTEVNASFRECADVSNDKSQIKSFDAWWNGFETSIEKIERVKSRCIKILDFSDGSLGDSCSPDTVIDTTSVEKIDSNTTESTPTQVDPVLCDDYYDYGLVTDELELETQLLENSDFNLNLDSLDSGAHIPMNTTQITQKVTKTKQILHKKT